MEKFTNIKSSAIPMPIEHVDTDQIIPARFLKATTREGFGENLFRDWRYHPDGSPIKDFVLNNRMYESQILVAGQNFGCGSSREHAAWAIYDYGLRVVVSSFFADIFKGNCLNNGILPVQLTTQQIESIFGVIEDDPNAAFEAHLPDQTFKIVSTGEVFNFDIDDYKKMCMLNGYDDLDYLLSLEKEIEDFEKHQVIY